MHAPPLNHVGLWIDDLRGAVAWLDGATACALRPAASARARRATTSASSIRRANDAFPIAGEGVLIELVQAPPDVIAAWQAAHDTP